MTHQLTLSFTRSAAESTRPALLIRDISGSYRPASHEELLAAAREMIDRSMPSGTVILDASDVVRSLQIRLADRGHEVFVLFTLDTRNRLVGYHELFRGSVNECRVHVGEVVKMALRDNAAAVIIAHNHPSGSPDPSQADRNITNELARALQLIDIRVLDHIVVAGARHYSFATHGLL